MLSATTERRGSERSEDGYVLITLILMVSLLIIAAAAIVPSVGFEIKRDREDELIHRGHERNANVLPALVRGKHRRAPVLRFKRFQLLYADYNCWGQRLWPNCYGPAGSRYE